MKVVIDHITGSKRGTRQEFRDRDRITFGRHPDSDVAFDPKRDLSASTRHLELRARDGGFALVDVGSSNGTFIDGKSATDVGIEIGSTHQVQLGPQGPQLRVWLGPDDHEPPPMLAGRRGTWVWVALAVGLIIAVVLYLASR